jgi:hypothetical protein
VPNWHTPYIQQKEKVMDFEIEEGSPSNTPRVKYPFDKLSVGTYFKFPKDMRTNISSAASRYGKANDMKFKIEAFDETHCACYRVS